ncbi:NHS-like protein 1 isoform X4 [Homo sapiens]|uniref:NHS-like protein 1 isoform X4 n=1 Tax=Homo sapiens TaxID=9606 RepID=UPI001FB0B9F3|nr:NHS-like protein 1 isoform X4 [Homo sapiens]XP_054211974.1 NHS-like protein 1 isoform X4 [Homo sapiens]
MPFHQRTLEPARLRRPEAAGAGAAGAPLFRSLEQVSSHALGCLLAQLADLSRCAGDIFGELEGQAAALGHRTAALHRRLDALQAAAARLDHRRVKIPVSNLDEESRWTVHYTAPWHQQENVFLPTTRPPCVEDLHRQAKLNLKSVLRVIPEDEMGDQNSGCSVVSECDKLRHDGYRSSQYYSQGPTFAANASPFCDDYQDEDEETDQKCSLSSSEEERFISIRRPKTPASSDFSDLNTQTNWTKSLPLPTPEEKMRQQAQTVQADVVPINITASGTGQDDADGHSVYTPDHYSTLGRFNSCRSAGQRSETRDSSCQTEDVKVVPPSMRRIRAQKGQGIAAQMGHFSGSSGNMSVLSDSAGIVFPSRLDSDAGFHSLPRSGARANIQSLEPRLGALGPAGDMNGTFLYQRGHPQADENLGHLGGASGTGTLLRPKSQELRHFESENIMSPACVVSPHATYSTSIIPNATLSSSSEVIAIPTAQSAGQRESKSSGSSHARIKSRDHLISRHAVKGDPQSPGRHWNEGHATILSQDLDPHSPGEPALLSLCDSAVPLNAPANRENGSQAMPYNCRNNLAFPAHPQDVDGKSESSYSGGGGHSSSEPWEYKSSGNGRASPLKPHLATPGYSTPTSNMSSCSLDQTSNKEDAGSLYSEDHDGYCASVHTDSGHGSGNLCNSSDGFGNPRHSVINVFVGRAQKNQGDRSNYQDKSLSRNISLKKAKKPPLPPSRTDSLRRIPKKSSQCNGQVLNESLIATLQHSLQLSLPGKSGSSPSQSPCSDLEEPWLPRSRSQSTVSAGSSMTSATTPNVYSLCGATPSQSDTSSVKSEYTDPWGYYIDYTGMQEDPGNPAGGCSTSSGVPTGNGPVRHVQEGSRATMPQVPGGSVKPKIMSPEKSHRVISPSSGYSSQSNTPTALTPVPVFLKSVSPANGKGKPKPKVPERKSSLISSVSISSSSTSLSSSTSTEGSGTMKKLDPAVGSPPAPPPPPVPSPPFPCPADRSPFLPPPPPVTDCSQGSPLPHSPVFPPPPPEALIPFCSPPDWCLSPPRPALSPILPDSPVSLPLPPPLLPSSEPPPAPPLDPKFMKDTRPPFTNSGQPESSRGSLRPPSTKEETSRPPMPLITTEALQMVQLRPVRKNSGAEAAQLSERTAQEQRTPVAPQYHLKPSAFLKSRNSTNEMESESQPASVTSSLPTPAKSSSQGDHGSAAERGGPVSRSPGAPSAGEAEARPSPSTTPLPDSSPSRKPPPISKKPKLFLVVPPPQKDFAVEPAENVSEALRAVPSPTTGEEGSVHSREAKESSAAQAGSHATHPGTSVLEGGAAGSMSPSRVEANVPMVQPDVSPAPKQEEPAENSADTGGDGESCLSQQDGAAGVPETNAAGSSSEACDFLKEDGNDEVMTPSRPRTTEDLFAAIHRSKRKVLGRRDSDDDHSRNHSPSPPVTPTGAAPSLASPKQVGSIQRSIRKSSTSSDNFKALLLKKGSRSDTSARMSAAEMLKNTDPRFQRSRSEPSPDAPESPSSCSPSKNRRAQEEWAKNEGLMPRSLSFSGPRYGRSRTPPSAASSRYSMRNRIQSSPMTVISEGEGEAVEPVDSIARGALGAAEGCSLDGLAREEMDEGGLLCGEGPAASLQPQAPGPVDGTASAEGREPSPQCGGSLSEES